MDNSIAALDDVVPRHDIFGIVVANTFQRFVFTIFRIQAVHDSHCNLNVTVLRFPVSHDKVAFKFSDSAHAYGVVF